MFKNAMKIGRLVAFSLMIAASLASAVGEARGVAADGATLANAIKCVAASTDA